MNYPKYVDNDRISILNQEKFYQNHRDTLVKIQAQQINKTKNQYFLDESKLKQIDYKKRNRVFIEKEKVAEIQQKNNQILNRIIQITCRDDPANGQSTPISEPRPLKLPRFQNQSFCQSTHTNYLNNSLHEVARQKEKSRIELANNKMVNKLMDVKPSINTQSMLQDFRKHKYQKQKLCRITTQKISQIRSYVQQNVRSVHGNTLFTDTIPNLSRLDRSLTPNLCNVRQYIQQNLPRMVETTPFKANTNKQNLSMNAHLSFDEEQEYYYQEFNEQRRLEQRSLSHEIMSPRQQETQSAIVQPNRNQSEHINNINNNNHGSSNNLQTQYNSLIVDSKVQQQYAQERNIRRNQFLEESQKLKRNDSDPNDNGNSINQDGRIMNNQQSVAKSSLNPNEIKQNSGITSSNQYEDDFQFYESRQHTLHSKDEIEQKESQSPIKNQFGDDTFINKYLYKPQKLYYSPPQDNKYSSKNYRK